MSLYDRSLLFESDREERELARRAATGDQEALGHYRAAIRRAGKTDEYLRDFQQRWRIDRSPETGAAYRRELEGFEREVPREVLHAHVPKVNRERAPGFDHGHIFHHVTATNHDGSPVRARVSGRPKLWKTRPDEFRIPVKHGMRDHFYITHENGHEWMIDEPDRFSTGGNQAEDRMSLYDRVFLVEGDAEERRLKRQAIQGDPEMAARLAVARLRAGAIKRPSTRTTAARRVDAAAARAAQVANHEGHDECAFCFRGLGSRVYWGAGEWDRKLPYCRPSCRRGAENF